MRSDGFFSILLFHVPDDVDMHKGGWWETCDQFLQSAGSADRMTVEVRRWEGDRYVHDAIARPGAQRHDPVESSERIVFGRHELWVDPAEVFDATTAAPLYEHYRQTGHVPDDYTLRELDLTWPPAT
jgi:hypothetical protein